MARPDLQMTGLPIFTVSKLIRHASVLTTRTHYAHLAAIHGSKAASVNEQHVYIGLCRNGG
jgi:hypothetical protein